MNPRLILLVLSERYKIAISVALLTIVGGMIGRETVSEQYVAETSVMVDVKSPDPVSAILLPPTMFPGNLGTQVDIIKSDRVAYKVVKILGLDQNPTMKQLWLGATGGKGTLEDWLANRLQRGLLVNPSRESNIILISFKAGDPGFVAAAANAYAQAYIETSVELKVEPAKQYARWFGDQAKVLRENVEKAQGRLSEYQQRKGIVATDESVDYELAKLNDLSVRLTAAQGETRDTLSKQRSSVNGPSDTLPEVMQNSVVLGLRTNVAQLEAKLKEAAGNLGKNHPQYLQMESELDELKNRLAMESRHVVSGYATSSSVGKSREAGLREAIDAQKKKLLDLKNSRDEIAVLLREVDTAKRSYEAVTNRYSQTSLESQATQANVTVLNQATEPLEPSFPKSPTKTLGILVIVGVLLAGALTFGLEMLDRRIRSADDLAEMLQLPVLAIIEPDSVPRKLAFRSGALALPFKLK